MRMTLKCVTGLMIGLITFSSCRTVYAPNAVNAPLLQEKGEFKAALSTNNLQLSTAVTNHLGVMANGYLNAYRSADSSFRNNGKGAEIGIGYFGHNKQRVTYEAYGGAGMFNVRIREADGVKTFDADAMKYFVQPSIGWASPFFEVAVSTRLSFVKYKTPEITGYTVQEQASNYFNVVDQKAYAFYEPTVTLRGGYKFVKMQVQLGHSFKLTENEINQNHGIGSIGIIFDIGKWYQSGI